jgi:hypothetical protein
MAGIHVAECAKFLVVAGDEGGAGMHAAGDLHQDPVQVKPQFEHRLRLIDVGRLQQAGTQGPELLLDGDYDGASSLQVSRYIK